MIDAAEAIRSLVTTSRRILLISHVAPDGDAIGSMLGLKWLLEAQGRAVIAANQDGVPYLLRSDLVAPGWQSVVHSPVKSERQASGYDLVITLDCSDMQRLGKSLPPPLAHAPLVNIDHHITNLGFGAVNLVDPAASSTAEIVYRLAEALAWPIGPEAAQCLLTGIVTDTQSFHVGNVTPALLGVRAAADGGRRVAACRQRGRAGPAQRRHHLPVGTGAEPRCTWRTASSGRPFR